MRDIKFRVWREGGYKKIPEEYVGERCAHLCMSTEQKDFCAYTLASTKGKVIEQFTGEQDAIGNDIYEGDIVGIKFVDRDGKEYDVFAEIVWERSSFCERWDVEDARYKGLHKLSGSSCLVCGNINEGISIPTDEDVMLSIIERETESLC